MDFVNLEISESRDDRRGTDQRGIDSTGKVRQISLDFRTGMVCPEVQGHQRLFSVIYLFQSKRNRSEGNRQVSARSSKFHTLGVYMSFVRGWYTPL